MLLTSEKIEVTHQMMEQNNMTRYGEYGVPVDPKEPSKGLSWKGLVQMKDSDFDKIEEYFLLKQQD